MKPPTSRYRALPGMVSHDPSDPLDTCLTSPAAFWATVGNAARVHGVDRDHLADTLRFVHAHETATAGVIYGCAARLAHAGYIVPPPEPPPPDPVVLRELAEANAESRRRSAARAREQRGRFAA